MYVSIYSACTKWIIEELPLLKKARITGEWGTGSCLTCSQYDVFLSTLNFFGGFFVTFPQFFFLLSPDQQSWNLWRKALTHTICNAQRVLKQPLGQWIKPSHKIHHQQYCPSTHTVFSHENNQWVQYKNVQSTRRHMIATNPQPVPPPKNAIPITDAINHDQTLKCSLPPTTYTLEATESNPTTFLQYTQQLPEWEQRLLHATTEIMDTEDIIQLLTTDNTLT